MHTDSTDRVPIAFRTWDFPPARKLRSRMVDGETVLGRSGAEAIGKVEIQYVQRLPHCAEDVPPDVVELWIGVSGRQIDVIIVRRGEASLSQLQ